MTDLFVWMLFSAVANIFKVEICYCLVVGSPIPPRPLVAVVHNGDFDHHFGNDCWVACIRRGRRADHRYHHGDLWHVSILRYES